MNPHTAHYHNKIKTLENTIQQLEGRIRVLTAGKQPEPSIEEQIAELAEIHGTTDITLKYVPWAFAFGRNGEWEIEIEWYKEGCLLRDYITDAPTLDGVLEKAKTLTKG